MDIRDSVVRVMSSQEVFGEAFYEVFFRRCPEARDHFSGIDMKRQALLLTMAVAVIEQYYSSPYPATEKYIQHLGTRHNARAIRRELYPKWRDAMLETLQRFIGNEWTDALGAEWSRAIDRCTDAMFDGYDERFVV